MLWPSRHYLNFRCIYILYLYFVRDTIVIAGTVGEEIAAAGQYMNIDCASAQLGLH